MKIRLFLIFAALGMSPLQRTVAQTSTQLAPSAHGEVVLSKPSPPIYPPLARVARISGDVEIALRIRKDGSIDSVGVVSGNPLLKTAALDSARQSIFECHNCGDAGSSYPVFYTFGYTTTQPCCQPNENSLAPEQKGVAQAGISQSGNHITIPAEPKVYL